MRVLLVTGAFPPRRCGVGHYTAHLAARLADNAGVDVGVLTSASPALSREDAPHDVLRVQPSWRLAAARPAIRAIREWAPDIVHVQYPTQGYDGLLPGALPSLVRWRLGIPVVETLHEYYPGRVRFPLHQVLPAREIVVVRPDFVRHARPWFRWALPARKITMVPNTSPLPRVELSEEEVAAVRLRHGVHDGALVAFFGFLYPRRGAERLFDIASPEAHHIVIAGAPHPEFPDYAERLHELARSGPWEGRATIAGYLSDMDAARLLAAADAVVLPFVDGGGHWNTSLQAAVHQGTFVLTTARESLGYDPVQNVHRSRPDDVEDLRRALSLHAGRRRPPSSATPEDTWEEISKRHLEVYRRALRGLHSRPAEVAVP